MVRTTQPHEMTQAQTAEDAATPTLYELAYRWLDEGQFQYEQLANGKYVWQKREYRNSRKWVNQSGPQIEAEAHRWLMECQDWPTVPYRREIKEFLYQASIISTQFTFTPLEMLNESEAREQADAKRPGDQAADEAK